jgi:hypothetical protein
VVKNAIRSSSALGGRVVDDTLVDKTLVDVEPLPFGLVVGVLAQDAPTKTNRVTATIVLRTTHLLALLVTLCAEGRPSR